MAGIDASPARESKLEPGAMGTSDIVFFVLAGVAPMGAVVALITLAIAFGNGAGVPGTYLAAGLVLALFSAGYVRMSRRIVNVGGFYTYAREGLGRHAGGATAYVALLSYNAAVVGIFGGLAYFASLVVNQMGLSVSWQACAVVCFLLVAVLAFFEVTLSAKVLGFLLGAEVLTLMVFNGAVLAEKGFHGFSLAVFAPSAVFGTGFGVSLMFAFGSYVGFEATALYGEEARNPRRSVPRATYLALAIITVFYLITSWAAMAAEGVQRAQGIASHDVATGKTYMFEAGTELMGPAYTDVMAILVVTSLFAAFLAFHANTARYHVALARDGLLPRLFARTHRRYGSPVAASALQLAVVAAATIGFTAAGQDPYLGMGTSLYSLGVLGIVVLQAIAAISIVSYFLRNREHESVVASIVSPALGAAGLVAGVGLMVRNYSTLTASTAQWVNSLPWALPVVAAFGAVAAAVAKARTRPADGRA
ncbi:APC family permease [Amycolatopsis sp. AA4]|uniref:APC family permease n=1 Tax=Actinomycetes TaxID=1760 RepID=UPI0001B56ABB|nr:MULTISPECIES: APC family permease [Actinomycetes]ATY11270.1 APC family permease [Amycolatopsis sp. AA4]